MTSNGILCLTFVIALVALIFSIIAFTTKISAGNKFANSRNSVVFLDIVKLFDENSSWKNCKIMKELGMKLDDYEWLSVKKNAELVYAVLEEGRMPPEPEGPWPKEKTQMMKDWIDGGLRK